LPSPKKSTTVKPIHETRAKICADSGLDFIKRQTDTAGNVPVNVAAMTDKDGNVLVFDANNVYKDASAKGL
jgi:hypothetical protein